MFSAFVDYDRTIVFLWAAQCLADTDPGTAEALRLHYELRRLLRTTPLQRCASINRHHGDRCRRESGHAGPHQAPGIGWGDADHQP